MQEGIEKLASRETNIKLSDAFSANVSHHLSVSHTFEGHVHASQGHQTSSEHRQQSEVEQEEAEDEGI